MLVVPNSGIRSISSSIGMDSSSTEFLKAISSLHTAVMT